MTRTFKKTLLLFALLIFIKPLFSQGFSPYTGRTNGNTYETKYYDSYGRKIGSSSTQSYGSIYNNNSTPTQNQSNYTQQNQAQQLQYLQLQAQYEALLQIEREQKEQKMMAEKVRSLPELERFIKEKQKLFDKYHQMYLDCQPNIKKRERAEQSINKAILVANKNINGVKSPSYSIDWSYSCVKNNYLTLINKCIVGINKYRKRDSKLRIIESENF